MSPPPSPADRPRPRITHLVLVDGLPADHWVEETADVSRLVRPRGGQGRVSRTVPMTSPHQRRDDERRWLEALVGGAAALNALHARPLEQRPLELPDLGSDLTHRAHAIGGACDRLAVDVFGDEELGSAIRRLWEAVLTDDPAVLRRSTRDDTAVGALVWSAASANGLVGPEGRLLARDLWARLGVSPSAAGRGAAMLERLAPGATLLTAPAGAPRLRPAGRPDVLLGSTRALLLARRDEFLADRESNP